MPKLAPKPFWTTNDGKLVKLYQGDVVDVLSRLPANSVHMVVTSPPYWGLRSYDTGEEKHLEIGAEKSPDCLAWARGENCAEEDWENGCHVCRMVLVFREVRRVLRDDGTVWLNYGSSYGGFSESRSRETASDAVRGKDGNFARLVDRNSSKGTTTSPKVKSGLKSGNLVGVPWRVALALQADGWILRQDIIWHKPSPMPESVKNRCTKAHEYIFLLAKRAGYFYDAEAIKTDGIPGVAIQTGEGFKGKLNRGSYKGAKVDEEKFTGNAVEGSIITWGNKSNKRSVWSIASEAYPGAHFATFPRKLIEPCILAGTSEYGCCVKCGAPWRRVLEEKKLTRERPNEFVKRTGEEGTGNSCANSVAGVATKTVGWEPTCDCGTEEVQPCVVGDIFVGSGTSCCVALTHGRRSIGIDLSEKYLRDNAVPRVEGAILARPAISHLVGETEPVEFGTEI